MPALTLGSSIILFKIFYVWQKDFFRKKKNQKKYPSDTTIKLELRYMGQAAMIHILTGFLLDYVLYAKPYLLFTNFFSNAVLSFIASFVILVIVHDAYFYWLHRLIHVGWLYDKVHVYHHKFLNPTPFSTLATHPVETFLLLAHIPFIVCILPVSETALTVFVCMIVISSTFGHLGFEMRPHSVFKKPIIKHLITTTQIGRAHF